MILLSVAVPAYNAEKYLGETLSSFCDGRFFGLLQVIIVNDGSSDGTEKLAREFTEKYPQLFELVNKENGGHGSAVNAGLKRAKGKYFRIVDGDDSVNTENLYRLLLELSDCDTDLVVDEKREDDMSTGSSRLFELPWDIEEGRVYSFTELCGRKELSPYIMLHTLSVKTSLLLEHDIRLLTHTFYVDIEFIIKATVRARDIKFLRLELYRYRVGNEEQSVNYRNYVRRYSQHSRVTLELVRFARDFRCEGRLRAYLDTRICLLINTNMNIALIYNENRREGLSEVREFRAALREESPYYYGKTLKRYKAALFCHFLGLNYGRLEALKRLLNV